MLSTKKEEIVRLIMNASPDATICFDAGNKIIFCSRQAEKMLGWNEHEIAGRLLTETIVNEKNRHSLKSGMNGFFDKEDDQPHHNVIQLPVIRKNGSEFPAELTFVSIREKSGAVYCVFVRDITDLNKAEDREHKYRSLFEQASDAIMVTDFKGNFADVNESLCKMMGYSREELLTMNVSTMIDKDQLRQRPMTFDRLAQGEHVFSERLMIHRNGTVIEVEANIKKISDQHVLAIVRDVTAKKHAERMLQKSEANLRAIFDNTDTTYILLDKNLRVVTLNTIGYERTRQFFGKKIREGDSFIDSLPEYRRAEAMGYLERVLQGHVCEYEALYHAPEGKQVFFQIKEKPIRGMDGEILGVCLGATDITERKKTQEDLITASAKLKFIFDTLEISFWGYDVVQNRMLYVSPGNEKTYGYEAQVFLDNPNHWHEVILQEDRHYLNAAYADISHGKSSIVEFRIRHADGSIHWIEGRMTPTMDDSGNLIRLDGVAFDITGRKNAELGMIESESRFRTIFETEPECVKLLDRNCCLLDMNPAGLAMIEADHIDQVRGHHVVPLVNERFRTVFLKMASDVLHGKTRMIEFEITGLKGTQRWMEMHAVPIRADKEIVSILSVSRDVTARKIYEEEIKSSREELRKLSSHLQTVREEERTTIAREIHDELGQQLTGLKMDVSWLAKKTSAGDKAMREKITNMLTLVDETVKTVRHISSKLRPGILDDLGLVDALDWQSSEFEKRTGIQCRFKSGLQEVQFEKNLSTGIFRIYQETLTNVARHARATEIQAMLEQSPEQLMLKVHDNGKGFDETEVKAKHTLGIIGMKERASMFGGKISFNSQKGSGTSVVLEVPLRPAAIQTGEA